MLRIVVVSLAIIAADAHAQPAAAIGKPLPVSDLPVGTIVVRVIDGLPTKPVADTTVWLDIDGKVRNAAAGPDGRATFSSLPVGASVVVTASANPHCMS